MLPSGCVSHWPRAAASRKRKSTAPFNAASAHSVSAPVTVSTGHTQARSASAVNSATSFLNWRRARMASVRVAAAFKVVASSAFSSASRASGAVVRMRSRRSGSRSMRAERNGEPPNMPANSSVTRGLLRAAANGASWGSASARCLRVAIAEAVRASPCATGASLMRSTKGLKLASSLPAILGASCASSERLCLSDPRRASEAPEQRAGRDGCPPAALTRRAAAPPPARD